MSEKLYIPILRIHLGRFFFLLLTFISLFAIRPFLEGYVRINFLMDVFISAVLISGMYAVSEKRRTFIVGLIIGLPTLMFKWSGYFFEAPVLPIGHKLLGAVFCAYLVGVITRYIFRENKVTQELIRGAICVYFLIGFMFAYIFAALEGIAPGSFNPPAGELLQLQHFTYFSYITLTTLGYGDMTPLSNAVRSLAQLEAIIGQLYIAVTIARLVGLHIADSQRNS